MRLIRWSRSRIPEIAVALTFLAAYAAALLAPAVNRIWTGPDFLIGPFTGANCLLTGWLHFPVGWTANPIAFAASLLLITKHRTGALLLALISMLLTWIWNIEFCSQFPADMLLIGYHWWKLSIGILCVGSLGCMILNYSDTWQSLKMIGQILIRPIGKHTEVSLQDAYSRN